MATRHARGGCWMKHRWSWVVGLAGLAGLALVVGAAARSSVSGGADKAAATKVTLQLKWVTQAQFAGYYAAKAKGYYKQQGLDVNIKVGGPTITPSRSSSASRPSSGSTGCPACSRSAIRARRS